MIHEADRYHGAVLRELVMRAAGAVKIEAARSSGRVTSYVLDARLGLLVKHSSKRLPPWQFTFTEGAAADLSELGQRGRDVWIALVCGDDGMLALTRAELSLITRDGATGTAFVRVDRDKRSLYRVSGNAGALGAAKPRGLQLLLSALENSL